MGLENFVSFAPFADALPQIPPPRFARTIIRNRSWAQALFPPNLRMRPPTLAGPSDHTGGPEWRSSQPRAGPHHDRAEPGAELVESPCRTAENRRRMPAHGSATGVGRGLPKRRGER